MEKAEHRYLPAFLLRIFGSAALFVVRPSASHRATDHGLSTLFTVEAGTALPS
jgi:hypothetical protein